jgi:CheY-like chemotaxis protein
MHQHAHHPHRRPHAGRHTANGTAPRRKAVLVLEDYASIGGLIAALLRQEGYRVVRAWDTQEALRSATGRKPDLVVLDLNLPWEGALAALHQLRGHEATRRSPVVVITATAPLIREDEAAMVSDVVAKPFDIDVMLNAVRRALGEPEVEVPPREYDPHDYFLHGY